MRHSLPSLAALMALAVAAPARAAAAPELTAELHPAEATVGDRVEAVLTLSLPPQDARELNGEPRFPPWGESWGEAEVLAVEAVERAGPATWRQRLVLAAFRPGAMALPPVEVAVPAGPDGTGAARLTTPGDLTLRVRSVLPPEEEGGAPPPLPPRPPRPLAAGAAFLATAALLAAACLALALLLARRRRRAAEEAAARRPPATPFEELEAALARLAVERAAEPFHTGLSLALRRYLARRLGFPALESTTREVRRELTGRHLEVAAEAAHLLARCDRVRFARGAASEAAMAELRERARRVALAIEEHLRPAGPAGGVTMTEAAA